MNLPTKAEVREALQAVAAVGEVIGTLGEVPSGHLYAAVMGVMSLDQYTRVIALLKRAQLVSETGHVLKWTGPKLETK